MDAILGFNWAGVIDFLPALARGLYYTLLVSVGGLAIGFVLGAIAGLARLSRFKVVNWIAIIYIEAVRGTPVLVQAIWIYFALPLIIKYTLPSVVAGIIVIASIGRASCREIEQKRAWSD